MNPRGRLSPLKGTGWLVGLAVEWTNASAWGPSGVHAKIEDLELEAKMKLGIHPSLHFPKFDSSEMFRDTVMSRLESQL